MLKLFIAGSIFFAIISIVSADEAAKTDRTKITSATYLITGLHCPGCTKVVEGSLSKAAGVRSVKVDWSTKDAKIEFDESTLPAARVAQLIAATPHMMGPTMHYDGWLALKASSLKDVAMATAAKESLGKVPGVKKVETFPTQHVVEIQFAADAKTTTGQLIEVLAAAGVTAENY